MELIEKTHGMMGTVGLGGPRGPGKGKELGEDPLAILRSPGFPGLQKRKKWDLLSMRGGYKSVCSIRATRGLPEPLGKAHRLILRWFEAVPGVLKGLIRL